jgi:hypothetical protein
MFEEWDGRNRLDRSGSRHEQVAGPCECGNKDYGDIKYGEFLDYLRTC